MKNKKQFTYIAKAVALSSVLLLSYFFHGKAASPAEGGKYKVISVIDGDTIELSGGARVRYIGVDTPETREKKGNIWVYHPMPYAEEAKEFNRRFVDGKIVRLEFDVQKKDVYGRLLAYVYVEDKMVNIELLKEGYAMLYTYPPNVKHAEEFLKAQGIARENKSGLWSKLGLEEVIQSSEAKDNIGFIKIIETEVVDTYISKKVLTLKCRDKFKVAIFKDNFAYFPKEAIRSPDNFFKNKTIRVYGVIKEYKGSCEIIANTSAQVEIIKQ